MESFTHYRSHNFMSPSTVELEYTDGVKHVRWMRRNARF